MSKRVLIMAGGTGGHVFPGLALADALVKKGWHVDWLGTAERMEAQVVPQHGYPIHFLPVQGIRGKGIKQRLLGVFKLVKSLFHACQVINTVKPDLVIGMGGYASGPGGVAAKLKGIPLIIHEQNAAAGMTNRLLARIANKVLLGFEAARSSFNKAQDDCIAVGNPVRKAIMDISRQPNAKASTKMLVVGGSLGAQILNTQVPIAVQNLEGLNIRHQCGKGNSEAVKQAYGNFVQVEVADFIDDMSGAYRWADFIVCRAGALTVAEVSAAGIAAIFVPLPHAVDDHQTKNGATLADKNAAILIPQTDIQTQLPKYIKQLVMNPVECAEMGQRARDNALLDATEQVVNQCELLVKEKD